MFRTTRPRRKQGDPCRRWARCLLLIVFVPCVGIAAPKRVLILDPFGHDIAPFREIASSFREELAAIQGETVDFYKVSLDRARFADAEEDDAFVALLADRFRSRPVDLVVPIGGEAALFMARHRRTLFPDTPMLVTGSSTRMVPANLKEPNTAFITQRIDLGGAIEDILQLRPRTTNIVVVVGGSVLESYWLDECRREFQPYAERVSFTWLDKLSFPELLDRCESLPPHSAILYALFVVDAEGVPYENHRALRRLHEVTNAPIFSYFESDIGVGAVGGHGVQESAVGAQAAALAGRILRGEKPEDIAPREMGLSAPIYDWRELKRWNIPIHALPPDSEIRFRQPSIWSQYRWHISTVAGFVLAQSILIVGLNLNRTKRRRAEARSRDLSRRLIRAHEAERARLGRELHDDLTQRLARLAIDASSMQQAPDESRKAEMMSSIHDGLVQLSEDTHALSYRLHPSMIEDLGLAHAVRAECEHFENQETVVLDLRLETVPSDVSSETALCLFRVVQEALRNVARHARASTVRVTLETRDQALQLTVCDDGVGFDPAISQHTPTLGLASMRERIELVKGTFRIERRSPLGMCLVAQVPWKESPS